MLQSLASCAQPFISGLGTPVVIYTSWAAPQFDPNAHVQESVGEAAPTVGKPGCNSPVQSLVELQGTNSMPWEKWEFNKEFFKSLSRYRKDHPETNFSRVLDNIFYIVENGKDLLEAIPDGPVPIRGFVKALACLLKLGVVSQMAHQLCVPKQLVVSRYLSRR